MKNSLIIGELVKTIFHSKWGVEPGHVIFQDAFQGMDSHLEVFSRNPTDDSFVVSAFQKLATLTKYLNEVFLSYWPQVLPQHQTHQ